MSDTNIRKGGENLSEEQVVAYLRKHLDFFTRQKDLLTEMELPHNSGKAISLVERQVSILRERNIDMRQRLSNLLDNARENDRLFDRTKRLVLALLESHDLGDLVDSLYYSFDKEFNIHYTRLVLFGHNIPPSAARIDSINNARYYLAKRLKSGHTVSGCIDVKETEFLFDDDAPNVGSAAMAVLVHGNPIGILAIGNQDPTFYRSSMGTLFLGYIAEVLNRLLPQHINR